MTRSLLILVGFALALPARGDVVEIPQRVIDALTPIDSLPSSAQLNDVFNGAAAALANLQSLALHPGEIDVGLQLRAVRSLTHYCADPCLAGDPAHATIEAVANHPRYRDSRTGGDVLVLRAALEALGILRVPSDVSTIIPQLEHPSRDIRAAAASSLRDLGNPLAISALRVRYQHEQVPQVRLAISDALRALGQPI